MSHNFVSKMVQYRSVITETMKWILELLGTRKICDSIHKITTENCLFHWWRYFLWHVAQIPQCTSLKSHNVPFYIRNVHVCTFLLQNSALWDICHMHCGICEVSQNLHNRRFNSLWPCDAILRRRALSLLVDKHYSDVIMGAVASQITSLSIVYSTVYSGADQRKYQKLRVTGLCAGNSPVTGEFPAQKASNTANVSIWWRHHGSEWLVTRLSPNHSPRQRCLIVNWALRTNVRELWIKIFIKIDFKMSPDQ